MEAKTKIRFVFHKPKGERGVGKAIVGWTWLLGLFYNWKVLKYNYSHEEVWLPDEQGRFLKCNNEGLRWTRKKDRTTAPMIFGRCFSSTTRGDAEGVRFAPAVNVLGNHLRRWDYIECEVDSERLEVVLEEANKLVGAKYDFRGIFGFVLPLPIQNDKKWYCSEVCGWLKFLLRVDNKRRKRVSPRRAAYLLSRKYGQPKPCLGSLITVKP
jgi:hypothetical protein